MGLRTATAALLLLILDTPAFGQAAPTLEEVRRGMGIPSEGRELRGQLDTVGFASRPEQMAKAWELSDSPPFPEKLGEAPSPGVAALLGPHDDYLYAGRVYRQVIPLVTARTVILVGVFHKYQRFGEHDRWVFDPYRAWRTPDGPVPVSTLREEVLADLPKEDFVQDAAMHDAEHSLEAIVYWLRHQRSDVEILPVLVPAAGFERLESLTSRFGSALASAMDRRGWALGRDVAFVISSDGVHYGNDFKHIPFGEGGIEAYLRATLRDRQILEGPLAGPLDRTKLAALYATFVDPEDPHAYRVTWCGRFSLPAGLLLLQATALASRLTLPVGHPIAYATSVGSPELPLKGVGLGETAPANLYHFVGYPVAAWTTGTKASKP